MNQKWVKGLFVVVITTAALGLLAGLPWMTRTHLKENQGVPAHLTDSQGVQTHLEENKGGILNLDATCPSKKHGTNTMEEILSRYGVSSSTNRNIKDLKNYVLLLGSGGALGSAVKNSILNSTSASMLETQVLAVSGRDELDASSSASLTAAFDALLSTGKLSTVFVFAQCRDVYNGVVSWLSNQPAGRGGSGKLPRVVFAVAPGSHQESLVEWVKQMSGKGEGKLDLRVVKLKHGLGPFHAGDNALSTLMYNCVISGTASLSSVDDKVWKEAKEDGLQSITSMAELLLEIANNAAGVHEFSSGSATLTSREEFGAMLNQASPGGCRIDPSAPELGKQHPLQSTVSQLVQHYFSQTEFRRVPLVSVVVHAQHVESLQEWLTAWQVARNSLLQPELFELIIVGLPPATSIPSSTNDKKGWIRVGAHRMSAGRGNADTKAMRLLLTELCVGKSIRCIEPKLKQPLIDRHESECSASSGQDISYEELVALGLAASDQRSRWLWIIQEQRSSSSRVGLPLPTPALFSYFTTRRSRLSENAVYLSSVNGSVTGATFTTCGVEDCVCLPSLPLKSTPAVPPPEVYPGVTLASRQVWHTLALPTANLSSSNDVSEWVIILSSLSRHSSSCVNLVVLGVSWTPPQGQSASITANHASKGQVTMQQRIACQARTQSSDLAALKMPRKIASLSGSLIWRDALDEYEDQSLWKLHQRFSSNRNHNNNNNIDVQTNSDDIPEEWREVARQDPERVPILHRASFVESILYRPMCRHWNAWPCRMWEDSYHDMYNWRLRVMRARAEYGADNRHASCPAGDTSPIKVVLRQFGWPHIEGDVFDLGTCPVPCTGSTNQWGTSDAGVMIDSGSPNGGLNPSKGPLQGVVGLEASQFGPPMHRPSSLAQTEVVLSWTRDSDVYVNYIYAYKQQHKSPAFTRDACADPSVVSAAQLFESCLYPAPTLQELQSQTRKLAAAVISNCGSDDPNGSRPGKHRVMYMERLIKYVKDHGNGRTIDSVGGCAHIKTATWKEPEGYGRDSVRVGFLHEYKFTLSFENNVRADYLTEKIVDGYRSGALPVLWGGPEGGDFVPGGGLSHIKALDFESPEALGAFMLELDKDHAQYLSYFRWRLDRQDIKDYFGKKPQASPLLNPLFPTIAHYDFVDKGTRSWVCRTCELYAHQYCGRPRSAHDTRRLPATWLEKEL